MFYPEESLKRGGRFYLCWVADSWPLRFATITHRQLWSQDIRKICDDLIEVMTNESGRPTNRFSLRLSSQLMRGLVRLYQRKVTVFLSDLCMINANVIKNTNKKWNVHDDDEQGVQQRRQPQQLIVPQVVLPEEPELEQRVEELIQNSGNVVANIQEITLRESTIPEFRLPPNDGFGEENPELAFQQLHDRTLETMMRGEVSAAQTSGLELPLDVTDKSHDKTHDKSRAPPELQMERISEHDVSAFGRVTGEGLLQTVETGKDIPEIPDIPLPELHAPQPEKELTKPEENIITIPEPEREAPIEKRPVDIELEELKHEEPQAKRRRLKNKLIIDKKTKISGNVLRARIDNHLVELRCEDSADDIIDIRVPWEVYFRRPCHAGPRIGSNLCRAHTRVFMRNLGTVNPAASVDRELEEIMQRSHQPRARSILQRIEEVEEPVQERTAQQMDVPSELNISKEIMLNTTIPRLSGLDKNLDISDLPTQKIESMSQAQKRPSQREEYASPKRQRSMGYVSFRQSQHHEQVTAPVADKEMEKENIPETELHVSQTTHHTERAVLQDITLETEQHIQHTIQDAEKRISSMLQEAGLADIPTYQPMEDQGNTQKSRRQGSQSSETPLGSLDRTKVSLGDSEQTTDSKRFIRDHWGTEGTMVKIMKSIKSEAVPVTVKSLIEKGPIISSYKKIIVALCFTSILKLKQHGFVKIKKDPVTLEIRDIKLGPKFY